MSYYSYLCTATFKIGFLFCIAHLHSRQERFIRRWMESLSDARVTYEIRSIWISYLSQVSIHWCFLLLLKLTNLMLQELTTGVIGIVGGQVSWSEGSISSQYEAKHLRCMIMDKEIFWVPKSELRSWWNKRENTSPYGRI